jgi:starch synthase
VLHVNDHHTALAAAFVRTQPADPFFASTATVFSIHNLGYQGLYPAAQLPITGLPPEFMQPMGPLEFWGRINLMKVGLVVADQLVAVSPTYAREIQEGNETGYGLEGVLRARHDDLVGILNGIDDRIWDPATDPYLPSPYDRHELAGKQECTHALRARLGLRDDPSRPLIGSIGRLVSQKGIDLLLEALPALLPTGLQWAILGSGQSEYERALMEVARRWPEQVSVTLEFDEPLAHAIEAGSDFFLMPSRYEPCGLNQMYSLRYGSVPIVRRTGGLADTVREWDPSDGTGTGFLFGPATPGALEQAVHRALATFANPAAMLRLRRNGMLEDFSWRRSARAYLEVYRAAVARRHATRAAAPGPA